jgi:hypothetical protein
LTGATAQFTVAATGSGNTYQWKRNGTDIADATAATYTTAPATYLDNDAQFTVDVSNAAGLVTSTAAQLTLALSPDQQTFESLILSLASGSFSLSWNLNLSGPQVSGTNYAYAGSASLVASPLTQGPQIEQSSAPQNMTTSLAVPGSTPSRYLSGNSILVLPDQEQSSQISYVGSRIEVDSYAADNLTVLISEVRSALSLVPLTGTLATTPSEFAQPLNSFFTNPAILNLSSAYNSGAAYLKYTATTQGDRYPVFDCHEATTDANVSACVTGTSLTDLLTAGYASDSDGVTYHLTDGTLSTVGGVQIWIATEPRPQTAERSSTVESRIYFELNGNVYTGRSSRMEPSSAATTAIPPPWRSRSCVPNPHQQGCVRQFDSSHHTIKSHRFGEAARIPSHGSARA